MTRPTRLLHQIGLWGPPLAYGYLIFYLSSLSHIPFASEAPDYLEHGVEYFGLAVLMARALNDGLRHPVPWRTLVVALLLCVGYAATDEIHQMFVPNRFADITDVLSDAVGASLGLATLRFGQRLLSRPDVA